MDIENYLIFVQSHVNQQLEKILPSQNKEPRQLHQAMRYTVFNGGKRLRAALMYATGESLKASYDVLSQCSAAIELIHAFSLIHDDLPAIDNDDMRRGKPACHIAFDEATAILAGDALLALAFEVLANMNQALITPKINLYMIKLLSHYIGSLGMAGGESLDVMASNPKTNLNKLNLIYKLKSGNLISLSVLLAALCANCQTRNILENLKKFGINMGLAFQIHDDIIGLECDSTTLGKPQCSDVKNHKSTYPLLIGIKNSKLKEQQYYMKAIQYLKKSTIDSNILLALCHLMITRKS